MSLQRPGYVAILAALQAPVSFLTSRVSRRDSNLGFLFGWTIAAVFRWG